MGIKTAWCTINLVFDLALLFRIPVFLEETEGALALHGLRCTSSKVPRLLKFQGMRTGACLLGTCRKCL